MATPDPDEAAKLKALSARLDALPENIRLYTTLWADIQNVDFPEDDILSDDPRLWVKHYERARSRLKDLPIEIVRQDVDTGDWEMMIELGIRCVHCHQLRSTMADPASNLRYYTGCTIERDLERAMETLSLTETMLDEELATPGGDQDGAGDIIAVLYRVYGRMNLDTYKMTQSSEDLLEAANKCQSALFFTSTPAPVDLRVVKMVEETLGYIHAQRAEDASSELRDLWDVWDEYKTCGPGAFLCATCRTPATPDKKLMKCAGCPRWKKPSYCSAECQRTVRVMLLVIRVAYYAEPGPSNTGMESAPQERVREAQGQGSGEWTNEAAMHHL